MTVHSDCFTQKRVTVDGYEFSMFNYLLPSYSDFKNAHPKGLNGFELRGLTFRHPTSEEKGPVRCLMLHKFFNVNQTEKTLVKHISDLEIASVHEKLDGSMIRFILLPNGKIVAKTKMSFDSPQAHDANKYLHDRPHLLERMRKTLKAGIVLIFEWTAPDNQIVVPHKHENLRLLQARLECNGAYLNLKSFPEFDRADEVLPTPTLDQLLKLTKTVQGQEGWVVRFSNGLFIKVKTEWYIASHKIASGNKPHDIARMVLEERIDDLFGIIDETHPAFELANKINDQLTHYINHNFQEILKIARTADFTGPGKSKNARKEFAREHGRHPHFRTIMIVAMKGEEVGFETWKSHLLKLTKMSVWKKFAAENLDL
jgi:T4 RnlA family RNA ligase